MRLKRIILGIIIIVLAFELVRDSQKAGDFIGYVNAGNLVLSGSDIYSDRLNTWPPFLSIFSVSLALVDRISPFLVRFLWLVGSIISMFMIMKLSFRMALVNEKFSVLDSRVFFPMLITFRFLLSNLANIQNNIYMMLLGILSLYFFSRKKEIWAGFSLALGISLKVYLVFLLAYFLYKREFRTALWTFIFLIIFNGLPFAVFGYANAWKYYLYWYNYMVAPFATAAHKNQSFFSLIRGLLSRESPGLSIYINVLNLSLDKVRYISYSFVGLVGIYLAFIFKNRLAQRKGLYSMLEYGIVFTMVPLFTPSTWKAYFIFLWLSYFMMYIFIFRSEIGLYGTKAKILRGLFWGSVGLNVLTVEGLIGRRLSDIAEVFSCLTLGSMMCLASLIIILVHYNRFKATNEPN